MCHAIFKGKKKKEIFFSSYICHPSMVNNELSGPVILNKLMKYIKEKYKKTNYSYRFTLLPETIGSISYLSRYKNILKKNVIAGFNLTCLGDNREYTHLSSRKGNTLADRALQSSLFGLHNVNSYPYLNREAMRGNIVLQELICHYVLFLDQKNIKNIIQVRIILI